MLSSSLEPLRQLSPLMKPVALGLEVVGVVIIVLGALLTTVSFIRRWYAHGRPGDHYQRYRSDFGKAILLGLEFLVAADIIGTVAVGPTFQDLGILAILVVIRTFLSFSLEVEISGRWPWQPPPPPPPGEPPAPPRLTA